MMYTVIKHFTDLQDSNYKYKEGDVYPRKGYTPSEERIKELSGTENKQKTALIQVITEAETVETVETSAIEETAEEVPAEKPKRKSRKKAE